MTPHHYWHLIFPWWRHQMEIFPRYRPFVRGIHRSPVNCPHKGQWRGALMFSLICTWIKGWVNNGKAGDLRRYRAHHGVTIIYVLIVNTVTCTSINMGIAFLRHRIKTCIVTTLCHYTVLNSLIKSSLELIRFVLQKWGTRSMNFSQLFPIYKKILVIFPTV